ncbi:MAG TPA: SAM-dependent methyltransferase [Chthoniobacterales bacterium]|nr:SAM-dependent methyltransferase [Chthoniobacterales bacterium]
MASWLAEIATNEGGRLRFDRFMELAMFHPVHGYYTRRIRGIGQPGDFSTSTTLSPALGKAVFHWLAAEAKYLRLDPLIIIEPGVGTGALAKLILSQMRPWSRVRYFGFDLRPESAILDESLRRQRRFRLFDSIEAALQEAHGKAIIISNEFVDAFPCRRLVRLESGWADIYLRYDDDQWRHELSPAPVSVASSALDASFSIGQTIEIHESFHGWLASVSAQLDNGAILTIDYGGRPKEIYYRRPDGTVRGYFRQKRIEGADILRRAGFQDLTADVNFEDLQTWGESLALKTVDYRTQREFVARWNPNALKRADAASLFTLDEQGAGTAFKVLHQRKLLPVGMSSRSSGVSCTHLLAEPDRALPNDKPGRAGARPCREKRGTARRWRFLEPPLQPRI